MKKNTWALLSLIVIAAMSLAACGAGQTSTPEPIYEGQPFVAGEVTWTSNGPDVTGHFYEDTKIASMAVDGFNVLAKARISWMQTVGETSAQLDIDVELVDPTTGDLLSYLTCWYKGASLVNPGEKDLETVLVTKTEQFKCDLPEGISLIGTFTIHVDSVLNQTLISNITKTTTPTRTPLPTATENVPPLNFLSFGTPREIGTDTDGSQVSWIFNWTYDGTGYLVSTSATKIWEGFGDSGLTPAAQMEPTWAFKDCVFLTGPYKDEVVKPCYIYSLDVMKVTAPGLKNPENLVRSQINGGLVFYQPHPPLSTPTITFTPTATGTGTPTATFAATATP